MKSALLLFFESYFKIGRFCLASFVQKDMEFIQTFI